MKRLLFVIHGFPPFATGGVENNTFHLAQALSKSYEIFVFTREADTTKKDFEISGEEYSKIKITRVVNNFRWQGERFVDRYISPKMNLIFEDFLKEVNPHLVHIQHLVGLSTGLIDLIRKSSTPMVLSLHDYWFGCHRTNLLTNTGVICRNRSESIQCVECALKPHLTKVINSKMLKWLKERYFNRLKTSSFKDKKGNELSSYIENLSDSIPDNIKAVIGRRLYMINQLFKCQCLLCPSKWVEDVYKEFGFDFNNYQTIPIGCTLPPQASKIESKNKGEHRSYPGRKNPLHIGYAGAVLRHKGVHILIDAMNILNERGFGKDLIKLSIFGDSNDKKYLEELRSTGSNIEVEFKGQYRHENVYDILSELDLLVLPSLWHETYSIIIREAFLAGVPVITTDLPAQKDGVTDLKSGLLVKPGDPQDLADKIEHIHKNPIFIERAKEYIESTERRRIISIEEYASRVSKIYDDLLP